MIRVEAVKWLNSHMKQPLNILPEDVYFIQKYILHKTGEHVPYDTIRKQIIHRSRRGGVVTFLDAMTNHLMREFKINTRLSDRRTRRGNLIVQKILKYE